MTDDIALHAPSAVRALLERHGVRADKSFGQNFLVDRNVLTAIVNAAGLSDDEVVLEVGPGLGVLTRELADRAGKVIAVELDRRLLPVLAETLAGRTNVEVVEGDALEFDLAAIPRGSALVANLPYNVATPVIARALESGRFSRLVVMIQKEVAERLTARASDAAYGALSLLVEHFAVARTVRTVPPGCFFPPPEVTSAVVRIDTLARVEPDPPLFDFIHTAFRHRRKTLAKNLEMAGVPRPQVHAALEALNLDSRVRAEALSLTQLTDLFERLRSSSQ